MSRLTIYPDNSASQALLDTTDGAQIAAALEPIRVRFERWSASRADSVSIRPVSW